MNRYDICIARLDPVQGSEMGKTRPVVIVSDDLEQEMDGFPLVLHGGRMRQQVVRVKLPAEVFDGADGDGAVGRVTERGEEVRSGDWQRPRREGRKCGGDLWSEVGFVHGWDPFFLPGFARAFAFFTDWVKAR